MQPIENVKLILSYFHSQYQVIQNQLWQLIYLQAEESDGVKMLVRRR